MRRLIAGALLLAGFAMRGNAQTTVLPVATPQTGEVTVTLVTFALGPEVFERFGHNALWFHDNTTGQDVAYHWGLFSFNEPNFLARFLSGDNHYWMGREDPRGLIDRERRSGRTATLQRLNLTPEQAHSLHEFVLWNERPENRFYRYDYFADNCSTRLRDAIDRAVGGAIKRATDTVHTALSYRRESIRLTDGDRPVQLGIDIALGRPADAPLTAWQSFFIPMRLRDAIRTVKIPDENGALVPLVAEEQQVAQATGTTAIEEQGRAPRLALRYFVLGVLLALLVGSLTFLMPMRSATWGLAFFGAGWSLISGILGVILLLAWLFTKHVFWAGNENVLLFTPLALFLAALYPAALLSGKAVRAAQMIAGLLVVAAFVAACLALMPGGQENRAIVALMLPVQFALYVGLRSAMPRGTRAA